MKTKSHWKNSFKSIQKITAFDRMCVMRKRDLIATVIVATVLFSGCGSKAESQVRIRDEGITLMESGDNDGAIEKFNEALAISIGKVTELEIDIDYYKAAAQYNAGYFDDAVETYSALIRYDEGNYKPLFLRGCIYASEGELSKAVSDYNAAVAVDEKNYLLYIQIYENLNALGYSEQGLQYLNQALEVSDKSANASYYKGRINFMLGQYAESEELLKKAIDKNIAEAKLYLAKLYQAQDNWVEAQDLLEEYAASEDVNSDALGALGDIEMANGNYESALSYYRAGLTLDFVDNYTQLYKGEVSALEHLYRFDEAKEAITQYLEMYPNDEDAKRELLFIQTR